MLREKGKLAAIWNHFDSKYVLISWLFLRLLAVIYFSAFASMAVQIEGLVGSDGILPFSLRLDLIEGYYPQQKFWIMPTVFWLNTSDTMLRLVCYGGLLAAGLLLFNRFSRSCLIVCYILYLSVVKAGQDFTLFQWDAFLLEIGFLAILLSWGSGIIILLFRYLLARFMLLGGIVKLSSGDPSWANFSALSYHYETQPLPTPVAYYAHHLAPWFHKICVGGVFFIELLVPFFVFLPRPFRLFACLCFILLQSTIILTGNYTFFNLLTIVLCVFLLEDRDVKVLFSHRMASLVIQKKTVAGYFSHSIASLWAALVLLVCLSYFGLYHSKLSVFEALKPLLRVTSTFSVVNNYGPFAIMTRQRNEIIMQGSNDGQHWSDYHFKYKPGALKGSLSWLIPHQPRLDWQMWFAALSSARHGTWFENFMIRLLEGSPTVLSLLAKNPFPEQPPVFIRAVQYQYSFSSPLHYDQTGQRWQRQNGQLYWPAFSLKGQ